MAKNDKKRKHKSRSVKKSSPKGPVKPKPAGSKPAARLHGRGGKAAKSKDKAAKRAGRASKVVNKANNKGKNKISAKGVNPAGNKNKRAGTKKAGSKSKQVKKQVKKVVIKKPAKKRVQSKTEKKLRGQKKYLNSKLSKIRKELEQWQVVEKTMGAKSKHFFDAKHTKVIPKTVKNILIKKAYKIFNEVEEVNKTLETRFKVKVKRFKKAGKPKGGKGFLRIPLSRVWEYNTVYDYILKGYKNKETGESFKINSFDGFDVGSAADKIVSALNFYHTQMTSTDIFYLTIDLEDLSGLGSIVHDPKAQTKVGKSQKKK